MIALENMPRLIVIEESLSEPLPSWLAGKELKRFRAELQDGTQVTIAEYAVHSDLIEKAIFRISELLHQSRYYAHIASTNQLLVAFRHCIFRLDRGDARTTDLCRMTGERLGIPPEEMQFEQFFDHDHPDLDGNDRNV